LTFSRSKLTLLLTLAVLLSVGLAFAFSNQFKPKDSTQTLPVSAEAVNEQFGLRIIFTLEKTEYSLGEPINITLSLTSIKNRTVSFSYFYNWWDFEVYNITSHGQNGLYWGDGGHMTLPHGGETSLGPGMNITEVFTWQQNCNATLSQYGQPSAPVSPGTYYIAGLYDYLGRNFDYNLQTTPIQITITQP
jgi:hypothetical protein